MARQYRHIPRIGLIEENRRFPASMFESIDRHALSAPAEAESNIPTLASYLALGADCELAKARAAWRWITARIAYDTRRQNYSAEATLRDRRGTCQGYAELFVQLVAALGLEAVEITGFGKGLDYRPGERVRNNHAWNAVRIDGKWYLLDCTYGAGFVRGNDFISHYREHYFCTPPNEFIYSNLPALRRWQLLANTVSKITFERLPFYRYGYFQYGLRQIGDDASCVIKCNGEAVLTFEAPPHVMLTSRIKTKDGTTIAVPLVTRKGRIITLRAHFPKQGDYYLVGWASDAGKAAKYAWAFTYLVQVQKTDDRKETRKETEEH